MMKTVLWSILPLAVCVAACSPNTDLEAANKKIASLEKQLAFEKAKNAGSKTVEHVVAPTKSASAHVEGPPASGQQWKYRSGENKMTGGVTHQAYVISENTVNFSFPYSGAQNGTLRLRTDPRYGKDVMFSIEKGQILCQSYQDCEVLVRFDEEKPRTYSAIGAADNSSDTIFIHDYEKFVGKMRKAKRVRISVNIYQQGSPVFEFDVSGFDQSKYQAKS